MYCPEDEEMFTFIKRMPKIELHAHLNGSLSQSTLQKLLELKNKTAKQEVDLKIPEFDLHDLSKCFKVFNIIHEVMDSLEALYLATCDVIKDFYNDGVHYLELRTTPKEINSYTTQEMYVDTVLKAIEDTCANSCKGMFVNLLLSIDRKRPLKNAEEMLKIAERLFIMSSAVVGIDLSGDPTCGDVNSIIPLLQYAKKIGLKLAIHISEIPGNFQEVKQLLQLQPDRLGHGTFLHPKKNGCPKNFELLKTSKIPLEICLSSNIICKTVPSYQEHHFPLFQAINYPCVFCTDDKGIFNTTLTKEYYLASQHYSLSKEDLCKLSYESINYAFAASNVKSDLQEFWKQKHNSL